MVAFNLAKMLREERVQKVAIASSGVNMTLVNNVALVQRAQLDNIEDLMLPYTDLKLETVRGMRFPKRPKTDDYPRCRKLYINTCGIEFEILKLVPYTSKLSKEFNNEEIILFE
ncbi:unnamed protein product [Sphenostylis stenocarpa]|uniref:Uncharacterized protein n=1 Tax=Sphenostylis stenocarpa TaxID=92480 RepID=A0AA86VTW8_9FABA|nr:unnamed protein product [Sphenostylis stenocarpa]